jgi:hypothetical protein
VSLGTVFPNEESGRECGHTVLVSVTIMPMSEGPLLLIDVDGVLNPLVGSTAEFRRYECRIGGETYTVRLNPRHGARLLELAVATRSRLVWASTWERHANEWIGPPIGLPYLPAIEFSAELPSEMGEMFKTPHIANFAGSRPFVWFDDATCELDAAYLHARPDVGDFLLVHVDARFGLTAEHLAQARDWLLDRARRV